MWSQLPRSSAWRRLFGAFFVSSAGDELTRIALLAKVYSLDARVSDLALAGIAVGVPQLLIAPLAGTLADRGHGKGLLVLADLARAGLLALIAVSGDLWLILAMAAVAGCFTALFAPVEGALEPDFLGEDEIPRATALRSGAVNVLGVGGPALAGVLIAAFGTELALLLDAASFLVSALLLLGLPQRPRGAGDSQAAEEPFFRFMREGFRQVLRDQELRALLLVQSMVMVVMGFQSPLFFAFATQTLGHGAEGFALLMSALGAGAVLGSIVLYRLPGLQRRPLGTLLGVLVIDACALFTFTHASVLALSAALMAVLGLISAAFQVLLRTYLLTAPPAEVRGRALGLFGALDAPVNMLGLVLLLPLTGRFAPEVILRGAAGAELAVVLLAALTLLLAASRASPVRAAVEPPAP